MLKSSLKYSFGMLCCAVELLGHVTKPPLRLSGAGPRTKGACAPFSSLLRRFAQLKGTLKRLTQLQALRLQQIINDMELGTSDG